MPPVANGQADYSPAAMAKLGADLKTFRQRLAAIDRTGWPLAARHDYQLVEAEMNGLDFDLRVLTPWARDPTFYANVFADWSDVPAHEGPYAHPTSISTASNTRSTPPMTRASPCCSAPSPPISPPQKPISPAATPATCGPMAAAPSPNSRPRSPRWAMASW